LDGKVRKLPKIVIVSHGRWGKDTCAEILEEFGFRSYDSSREAAKAILPSLNNILDDKYPDSEAAWADRHGHTGEISHRDLWFRLIREYNQENPARLASEIMNKAEIYCGMRSDIELEASVKQGIFDIVLWVDSSKRLPPEPKTSNKITPEMADIIIDNNGTEEEF